MAAASGRFASLTDEEFAEIIRKKDAENTIKATKKSVNILRAYLQEKGNPDNFESLDKLTLAGVFGILGHWINL